MALIMQLPLCHISEAVDSLCITPVCVTEMAIHDAKTAAFIQVEEVSQCCGTSITIEENMAEALTTHTVLSVTGCVRFFKFISYLWN